MPPFTLAIDRFNDSYIPEPNSGCWLWTLSHNRYGYGLLQCGRMWKIEIFFARWLAPELWENQQ